MTKFIDLTLNGISTGAIYAAVALALVLIWRSTRIVNFAQGAMLMFTTFLASAVIFLILIGLVWFTKPVNGSAASAEAAAGAH